MIPIYLTEDNILLQTRPNSTIQGFAYSLNTNTGILKKIIGNVLGLSIIGSKTGNDFLVYSSTKPSLFYISTKTSSSTDITPKTFPEKCSWSTKNNNYVYCAVPEEYLLPDALDAWYKGDISYSDSLWEYNLETGVSGKMIDLKTESGVDIDAINIKLSEKEDILIFENKKNGSLWSFKIN